MLSDIPKGSAPRCDVNQRSGPLLLPAVVSRPRKKLYSKTQKDILKMLDTEPAHSENLSPFNPLPAIGQRTRPREDRLNSEFKKQIKSGKEFHFILSVNNLEGKLQSEHFPNRQLLQSSGRKLNELKIKNQNMNMCDINNNKDNKSVTNILHEFKTNRSKDLQRMSSYKDPDSISIKKKSCNELLSSVSQKTISSKNKKDSSVFKTLNFECDIPAKDSSILTKSCTKVKWDSSVVEKDTEPKENTTKNFETALLTSSNLFQKRVKLLDRRKRESIPEIDEKTLKDLHEHMELKSKAKNESKELDYSSSSDGETSNALPKMSQLVGIFNNVQICQKHRGRVKKANNWF